MTKFKSLCNGVIIEFSDPRDIASMTNHPAYELIGEVEMATKKPAPMPMPAKGKMPAKKTKKGC